MGTGGNAIGFFLEVRSAFLEVRSFFGGVRSAFQERCDRLFWEVRSAFGERRSAFEGEEAIVFLGEAIVPSFL